MYPPKPLKLLDCKTHGAGAELFIVEGDSAAGSLALVRDEETQAVLPMQGKPLNAAKAGPTKTRAFPLYSMLSDALGPFDNDLARSHYERVILLMDPDADGIHCGALMLIYFLQEKREWLDAGRVLIAQAPLASIASASFDQPVLPHTDAELRSALAQCKEKNITDIQTTRFRGLAGIDLPTLAHACVHPQTRRVRKVSSDDARAAMEVFGGAA